jgi:hypothetical protein
MGLQSMEVRRQMASRLGDKTMSSLSGQSLHLYGSGIDGVLDNDDVDELLVAKRKVGLDAEAVQYRQHVELGRQIRVVLLC